MYTMLQLMFSPNYKPVSQCIQVHYKDCSHFASAKAGDKAQSSVVQRWMSSIFEMTIISCVCTVPQLNAYASFHTRLIFRPSFVALICLQLTIFLWNRGKYSAAVQRTIVYTHEAISATDDFNIFRRKPSTVDFNWPLRGKRKTNCCCEDCFVFSDSCLGKQTSKRYFSKYDVFSHLWKLSGQTFAPNLRQSRVIQALGRGVNNVKIARNSKPIRLFESPRFK